MQVIFESCVRGQIFTPQYASLGLKGTVQPKIKNYVIICDPGQQKTVISYMYSNSQQYIVWVKVIDFSFMPKTIRKKDHVS